VHYSRRSERKRDHEPEFGAEYCEQKPEIPNHEPELPEDFEDGKFNLILLCMLWS
jgi:hypothetical protein